MLKYLTTDQADKDIDEIVDYIAGRNVVAAISLDRSFYDVFEMFADNPEAGRERRELREDLRSFPCGSYIILYRLWAGNVMILRIVHGARDLEEIFS
ncbi:MAG: type II toxin-antitoxin system RelE/ParE family toxin [Pyrinomonadaceae bacterium]